MIKRREPLIRIKAFNKSGHSPLNLDAESIEAVMDFNAKIISGEILFEQVPCLCGSEEFQILAGVDRYGFQQQTVICKECGLIQSNPRMAAATCRWFYESNLYRRLYDGAQYLGTYEAFYTLSKGESIFRTVIAFKDCQEISGVLEVGSGGGWNLLPFIEAGMAVTGYDLSIELVQLGRNRNIPLIHGDAGDVEGLYDVIIMNHVLEHFSDPLDMIRRIVKHLNPEGILYIGVPDMNVFGLAQLQNAHNYYFTRKTLQHYMARCGLNMIHHQSEEGGHMSALFRAEDKSQDIIPLHRHYDEMVQMLRKYIFKYHMKFFFIPILEVLGLTEIIRRKLNLIR
jgi:2-polyprenyl-3-methyl-5-hydroxy-6-metoxy-1,4-benzoquinol methylase